MRHGSDPLRADSDADGISGGWDIANLLDPLPDDAGNDPDGDGLINAQEFTWFADPHNADSDGVNPADDSPLPLATGMATISVSSPDTQNWFDYSGYNFSWSNGNLDAVSIEILAGTGSPHAMSYIGPLGSAPLDSLEPNPQIEVNASGDVDEPIGGGSFVFRFNNADFGNVAERPRAVATVPDANVQLMSESLDMGDGTTQLKVVILNPHGFRKDNAKAGMIGGMSLRRSLRFSLVWAVTNAVVTDGNWQDSLQLISGGYFDLDGNDIAELSVTLDKIR